MSEKKEYIECPRCRGYCEVMTRKFMLDSDGSEDIGATPEVSGCPRCMGEGRIEKTEGRFLKKHEIIERLKKLGKI